MKDDRIGERMQSILIGSRRVSLVFRIVLGAVFIYAGIVKINDPHAFKYAIGNYEFFPPALEAPIAIWLPWVELIAGVCLIVGWWAGGSALIVAVLSVAFGLLTGMAILRGLDISCGCFSLGGEQEAVQWTHIAENGLLFTMALQVLVTHRLSGHKTAPDSEI
jgi:putative oxidoreductase